MQLPEASVFRMDLEIQSLVLVQIGRQAHTVTQHFLYVQSLHTHTCLLSAKVASKK